VFPEQRVARGSRLRRDSLGGRLSYMTLSCIALKDLFIAMKVARMDGAVRLYGEFFEARSQAARA
jgi:hypothetical protein